MASAYCIQRAEKCREEAARAKDDDIRAYWKEAERCWLALVQNSEAQPWPFVRKETEKVRLRTQGTFSLGQSDHVTVVVKDGDIVVRWRGSVPCTTSLTISRSSFSAAVPRPTTTHCWTKPGGRPTTRRASWGGLCECYSAPSSAPPTAGSTSIASTSPTVAGR